MEKDLCQIKYDEGKCYYIFSNISMTWEENRKFCNSMNMGMSKLTAKLDIDWELGKLLWIGGKSEVSSWTFVNGVFLKEIQSLANITLCE